MKKFLFASLLFLSSLGLYAENERTTITMMFPDGEKNYAFTKKENMWEYPSLIQDSSIYPYSAVYSIISKCKVAESTEYGKNSINICSFDSTGNFRGLCVFIEFPSMTSAKLWLDKYNESGVFFTSFKFSDIDLLDTDKRYYVYDKKNDTYLEIYNPDMYGGFSLSVSATFGMPLKWKEIQDRAKQDEENIRKLEEEKLIPKSKTKKKKK